MSIIKTTLARVCENCPLCRYARTNPSTALGRLMEWHGKWCPAWKAHSEFYPKATSSKEKSTVTRQDK